MNDKTEPSRDIVLFYPGELLVEQVGAWAARHPGFKVIVSFSSLPTGIRSAADSAAVGVIDATKHPETAMAALRHVMTRLGPESVAFYTEIMHPLLEMFVRVRGSLLLLGPMSDDEWDGFFDGMLNACWRSYPCRRMTGCRSASLAELEST